MAVIRHQRSDIILNFINSSQVN